MVTLRDLVFRKEEEHPSGMVDYSVELGTRLHTLISEEETQKTKDDKSFRSYMECHLSKMMEEHLYENLKDKVHRLRIISLQSCEISVRAEIAQGFDDLMSRLRIS